MNALDTMLATTLNNSVNLKNAFHSNAGQGRHNHFEPIEMQAMTAKAVHCTRSAKPQ